jgi:hypothetical protein
MNRNIVIALLFCAPAVAGQNNTDNTKDEEFTLERQPHGVPTGAAEHYLLKVDSAGIPSPGVVIRKDRTEIRDSDGKTKDSIARTDDPARKIETHFYPDTHGKVVGVHVTKGKGKNSESWDEGEYYILDAQGNKTLEIKNFHDNTRPIPSPSGDYAVGWPGATTPGGPPIFYDAKGVRNKWAHGFKGDGWPKQYETWGARFSPEGRYVAISAKNGDSGKKTLTVVYDSKGNKVFDAESVGGGDLLFSPDSAHLAYYSPLNKKLGLVDMKGQLVWEANIQALPRIFSEDGHYLLVMTGELLALVDAANGKSVWEWRAHAENLKGRANARKAGSYDGFALRSIAATPDLSRIVLTATSLKDAPVSPGKRQRRAVSDNDHLLIFNEKGRLIGWETFPGQSFKIPATLVQLSRDGRTIAVSMNDGIAYYGMKHK